MVVKTFPSVKIAEVPDNFIIKGFPFSVNSDLKVNGRISVALQYILDKRIKRYEE